MCGFFHWRFTGAPVPSGTTGFRQPSPCFHLAVAEALLYRGPDIPATLPQLIVYSQKTMAADSTTIEQDDTSAAQSAAVSAVYSLLALTMRYPDAAFSATDIFNALETLLTELAWTDDLKAFRAWRRQPIDHLDDLRTEHTRLFINAVPRRTVPPYASVYLDGNGALCGRTTERTRDFYRQHGYDLASETEPADHLSLELDFLAALTAEGKHEAEELFLRTLFRPWFEPFLEKSMKEARHPFFQVSIRLIDFFTKEEL